MVFSQSTARSVGSLPSLDIPPLRVVMPQFLAELRRARRYEHTLALVALHAVEGAPEPHGGGAAARRDGAGAWERARVLYLLLGYVLRNTLRETDILGAAPESLEYLVLLAETDEPRALAAVERIRERCTESLGASVRSGLAVFPADGFTVEDLLARARYKLEQPFRSKSEASHG